MPLSYPSLTPGTVGAGTGAYGGVPTVPDPLATAGGAITGNIGNLAGLYGLTTGVSGASAAGAATQYGQNLPLYGPLTSTASGNILSELRGQVPTDVINLLGEQAANRGVGFGVDSPNTQAAFLRSLGLTSLGLQQQGQQDLTAAIGRTPTGPAFNPASFLVSPGDVQGAAYQSNVLGSAPNPTLAAQAARNASLEGVAAGRGAVPAAGGGGRATDELGFPITSDTGFGAGGIPSPGPAYSTGTALTYGGVPLYGETPGVAGTNWSDWYNNLISGQTGEEDTSGLDYLTGASDINPFGGGDIFDSGSLDTGGGAG